MSNPSDRRYSETHEWFLAEDDIVTVGITQHAADELTDITYVELPALGTQVESGSSIGEVESVKATSELFTSIGGEIVEINTDLEDRPELINDDPFEAGWIIKIKATSLSGLNQLMDADAYENAIA